MLQNPIRFRRDRLTKFLDYWVIFFGFLGDFFGCPQEGPTKLRRDRLAKFETSQPNVPDPFHLSNLSANI